MVLLLSYLHSAFLGFDLQMWKLSGVCSRIDISFHPLGFAQLPLFQAGDGTTILCLIAYSRRAFIIHFSDSSCLKGDFKLFRSAFI